ncbi:hypothetical protein ACFFLS_04790 [Flavobacterium procerum]|uniref:Uncharacterized protein n=1 Tax=Flavobacterium procerum TaxID=1455569 RepID=A0ABV6BLM2_9FLAO
MKTKTILFISITIFILFVIYRINVYFALGLDTFVVNLLPNKKLPSEFVNYKNLSEVRTFGNHDIKLLQKGEKYCYTFQIVPISDEEIMVKVITKTESYNHVGGNSGYNYWNTLFKIDAFGKVLDTMNFKTSTSNQSEFGETVLLNKQIVNKALLYYQTWPTDGNKAKKDFIAINKNLKWTAEKVSQYYYDTIVPNCIYLEPFYAWRDKSIPTNNRSSLIYFANKQWYILYGIDSDISDDAQRKSLNEHKELTNENVLRDIPIDKITVKYFQKVEYRSNMMGRTQSSDVYTYYYWNGVAYINIPFENDTLKFKREDISLQGYSTEEQTIYSPENSKKEMENSLNKEYNFYSNPNLKFTLLIDDENKNLYIIKKIK